MLFTELTTKEEEILAGGGFKKPLVRVVIKDINVGAGGGAGSGGSIGGDSGSAVGGPGVGDIKL